MNLRRLLITSLKIAVILGMIAWILVIIFYAPWPNAAFEMEWR
jgi:hypothetical protein